MDGVVQNLRNELDLFPMVLLTLLYGRTSANSYVTSWTKSYRIKTVSSFQERLQECHLCSGLFIVMLIRSLVCPSPQPWGGSNLIKLSKSSIQLKQSTQGREGAK
jgi:hypothetical protein